jgi:hypothetical protein
MMMMRMMISDDAWCVGVWPMCDGVGGGDAGKSRVPTHRRRMRIYIDNVIVGSYSALVANAA